MSVEQGQMPVINQNGEFPTISSFSTRMVMCERRDKLLRSFSPSCEKRSGEAIQPTPGSLKDFSPRCRSKVNDWIAALTALARNDGPSVCKKIIYFRLDFLFCHRQPF
ncbi:MAG: hypothetical protein LBK67_04545 [Coriobacteriales bacterium]|jgi:hypothetical protein|nr:hypothetical protein [Coriobacteriales bacterium]